LRKAVDKQASGEDQERERKNFSNRQQEKGTRNADKKARAAGAYMKLPSVNKKTPVRTPMTAPEPMKPCAINKYAHHESFNKRAHSASPVF
jgi:hypothetical protein